LGNVRFGIPERVLLDMLRDRSLETAVETGTYLGGSARVLAMHFATVWTIERDGEIYAKAVADFERDGITNIRSLYGDSVGLLPSLLAQLDAPALFWLDAHWFPRMQISSARQCGLIQEIEAIAGWGLAERSVMLIDDMSIFGISPDERLGYRATDWPRIDEIRRVIKRLFPNHDQSVMDDVLILAPAAQLDV